jgi:hypothetical protein
VPGHILQNALLGFGRDSLSWALYKAFCSFVDAHNINMSIILNTLNDPTQNPNSI